MTQPRKMSDILKELAEVLLRDPRQLPSSEAMHAALYLANLAWNETLGLGFARDAGGEMWKEFEAENPELWNEFNSNDINTMIDELVAYKNRKFPDDKRRILICGMLNGNVHVEWLKPAAPGVDSGWEMRLFGLVKTGRKSEAIRFLQETRNLSLVNATKRVAEIAVELGMVRPM